MVYSTIKELTDGGYLECRDEKQGTGHKRRVCKLTPAGVESFRAAARVWEKMLPKVQDAVDQALGWDGEMPVPDDRVDFIASTGRQMTDRLP
jgi:DNA-binding PadR family transcriptional regulator